MGREMYRADVNNAIRMAIRAIKKQIKEVEDDKDSANLLGDAEMYEEASYTIEKLNEIIQAINNMRVRQNK